MFGNILKTTARYFFKNGFFSLINLLGLAIGLATSILIFLFVQDELSYDKHFEDAADIYRLEPRYIGQGEDSRWAATQGNLIPTIKEKYPEIKDATKLHFFYNDVVGNYEALSFNESNVLVADTNFIEFFGLDILHGDRENALHGSKKAIVSASTARRYFGDEDPVGKIIRLNQDNFKVAAVIQDMPLNSHFHYDIIISMDEFRARGIPCDQGGPAAYYSYVKFKDKASRDHFDDKVRGNTWEVFGYVVAGDSSEVPEGYELQMITHPITNIHLNGHAEKEIEANSDAQYIYIFTIVALFVLIIACINYMNLTTAKSFRRAKEVGVRKVLGAHKRNIFRQFMSESYLISFLAILIALIVVELILPFFNNITVKDLQLNVFSNLILLLVLLIVYVIVGFLSGSYPAVFLSRFEPLKVLKSNTTNDKSNKSALYFRRGLVILQFAISVILIIGSITVYRQLVFIQNKKLGFQKENVLLVKTAGVWDKQKLEVLKKQLLNSPQIESISSASMIPGERAPFLTVRIPGLADQESEGSNEGEDIFGMRVMSADEDVLNTFGFEISEGRGFSKEFGTDANEAFILNQAAVKEFELENPVGSSFEYLYGLEDPKKGKIIGVVEDFHYASLHTAVEPLMIHIMPVYYRYLAIRTNAGSTADILSKTEDAWMAAFPNLPFEYFFLDNYYDNLYKSELNLKSVITYFTILAIVIACLGLFGLAAYITELRTKEIGIRKVLGASFGSIVYSLSREFMLLIIIANILAWVPAYYFLNNWLDGYAFRISIGLGIFILTAIVSFFIAFVTVGMQAIKAAVMNPANALKYE
ncbi:MAG: ABC transporter permease [Bacteroidales bacterium]|nr:ABC transporter permease [Bacteroidales bacterium]MCF8387233.1 ABC transporter permease [Bacteroidales bacterium]MCF8397171.1 ABC transporter permease [Bacteroidales bacterium]